MKNQALFSSKDKSKKLKCHLLQFLFGALRVKACASRKDSYQSVIFDCEGVREMTFFSSPEPKAPGELIV